MKPKTSVILLTGLIVIWVCLGFSQVSMAIPPVHKRVLPNGLILLHSEEHSLPFVTIQLLINAGARMDPEGREGLASLASKGLLLGTSKSNVEIINERLDFMGASLSSAANKDYAVLTMRVLKKDIVAGLDLFVEILTQPVFPQGELTPEIEKTVASIIAEEDQPEQVAEKAFLRALFVDGTYGHPAEGTKESVAKITREDLVMFYDNHYKPNNSILTVVGDINPKEIKGLIETRFNRWHKGAVVSQTLKPIFTSEAKTIKIDKPITQANIIIGNSGVSRDNPDYYALTVMNYILGGGGFSSRLMEEIRNKRGLAYSVVSMLDPGKLPGSFQIILQTKNQSAGEAVSLTLGEMDKIRKEQVSAKELEGAKKFLIGNFPARFNTQAKLVNLLSQMEYYGLGLDYPDKYPSLINSVTAEDVLRVAKAYINPKDYVMVMVANLNETEIPGTTDKKATP